MFLFANPSAFMAAKELSNNLSREKLKLFSWLSAPLFQINPNGANALDTTQVLF